MNRRSQFFHLPEADEDLHRPGLLLRFAVILMIGLGLWVAGSVAAYFLRRFFA